MHAVAFSASCIFIVSLTRKLLLQKFDTVVIVTALLEQWYLYIAIIIISGLFPVLVSATLVYDIERFS